MIEDLFKCDTEHVRWLVVLGIVWILYAFFEYWLGKTSRVKSSSAIELMLTAGLMFLVLLFKRRIENDREKGS